MATLRAILNFVVAGALVGLLAVTLIYPRYKAWDNTPAYGKALCDCAETTRQTADGLIHAQLTGGAVGSGLGILAGVGFVMARRKKAAPTPPPAG